MMGVTNSPTRPVVPLVLQLRFTVTPPHLIVLDSTECGKIIPSVMLVLKVLWTASLPCFQAFEDVQLH